MSNTQKRMREKPERNPVKEGDELTEDELELVLGGLSLRQFDTANTTDISDDTKSKI